MPDNKKSLLKDLTWVEFAERLRDKPVILIPLGSQEEQGPQAPMGDFMLTERIAARNVSGRSWIPPGTGRK